MKLQHVIAATLVFLVGSISLLMGTLVLLGIQEVSHTTLKGLLVYNVVLGALSLLVAILIWKGLKSSPKFVLLILLSHASILSFLIFFVPEVALESIRAMEVRVILWGLVYLLIQWGTIKKLRQWTSGLGSMAMLLLLSTVFLLGCKQATKGTTSDTKHAQAKDSKEKALQSKEDFANGWVHEIQLDQGNKWQANVETTIGVTKMRSTIDHTAPRTISEYRQLGNELNNLKNKLVKECTMTGPSHDNLHVWLYPLIKKIEALQNVDNEKSGRQLTQNIAQHLKTYDDFFK